MSMVIIATLMSLSVACLPWPWLLSQLRQLSNKLGARVLHLFPVQYQSALNSVAAIELRLVCLVTTLLIFASATVKGAVFPAVVLLIGALTVWLPVNKVLTEHRQYQSRIIAALPAQLDLLAMLLTAGQPLLGSLDQAARTVQPNALQQEFRWLVGQVRSGEPLQRAIQAFAQRNPSREVRLMCHALQHARESGAGMADILQQQAEQRRQELFMAAERRAMEAPVKMMFPLLLFIFPATLLVLGVTLAAKVMWGT